MKRICRGWPAEYGGPLDALSEQFMCWATRPTITENDKGQWVWRCHPEFLSEHAMRDLAQVQDAGWNVTVHPRGTFLSVRIWEVES